MEDDAIVEVLLHQRLDLRNVLWREIGPQTDGDPAILGIEVNRVLRVGALRGGGPGGGDRGSDGGKTRAEIGGDHHWAFNTLRPKAHLTHERAPGPSLQCFGHFVRHKACYIAPQRGDLAH